MRTLIVSPSPTMRAVLRNMLEQMDFPEGDVEEAASGDDGLSLAIACKPDVIVLDQSPRSPEGARFLTHRRANRIAAPVLALINEVERGDMAAAFESGLNAFLIKPFSLDQLQESLGKLVRQHA